MDAIFFFFSLAGVLMVVHWLVTNDKAGNGGKTRGIFAMREPADIAAAAEAAARGTFAAQLAARSKPKPAAKPAGRRRPF
ncbi:MAG TPA: hypothetical protein VN795_00915 [Stellaceae bacterium]|nr:hypothetical protein [Stellaceae bacterium]